ncbi:hypothetical protein MJO28_004580 [Puccinia striiformis f. sp. tritici]|uniref:Uncharacterized protein n=1 Tax=Puccinia striiformis f. sp. tritici TaxID=168172 RepID=A0ACC0EQK2_9BASI|nr:hypothetical protein MJO28_004580 [Puccinia striiformis f. sp. tritici]KAI9616753.1 hypothetical protein KEM48_004992 [Puccinia striiformis f. sp. tritici PST-130]
MDTGSASDEGSSPAVETNDPIDEVIQALQRPRRPCRSSYHEYQEILSIDQLGSKCKFLHDLQTSVLPSFKQKLSALLPSLDLSEFPIHPCPNPELTRKIISRIDQILAETRLIVEVIAMRPPLPAPTHDHHLEYFKKYRTIRLYWNLNSLIHHKLYDFFKTCAEWIISWERKESEYVPENSQHPSKAFDRREQLDTIAKDCQDRLDGMIECCKDSDFRILQREWRPSVNQLTNMLKALANMINGTTHRRSWNRFLLAVQGQWTDEAHKICATQLVRSAIPIVKLGRLFYEKLSNPVTNQLPFTLDTKMSTDELLSLNKTIDVFFHRIDDLMNHIHSFFIANQGNGRKLTELSQISLMILTSLDEALSALASHLIPSQTTDPPSDPQNNFKSWFLPLSDSFIVAVNNFREIIHSHSEDPEE